MPELLRGAEQCPESPVQATTRRPTPAPNNDLALTANGAERHFHASAWESWQPGSRLRQASSLLGCSQIQSDEPLDPSARNCQHVTASELVRLDCVEVNHSDHAGPPSAIDKTCQRLDESRSRCPTGRNTSRSRSIKTLIAGSASASLSRHTNFARPSSPLQLAPSCALVDDGHVTGSHRPVNDSVRERRLLVVHEFRALERSRWLGDRM